MSNSLNAEDGLDYIFARMGAIYGAAFLRHWDGMDVGLVRQEWARQLGRFLTHKPSLDYAIDRLKGDFPPSAITFRDFCNAGPAIPRDDLQIEHNPTPIDPEVVKQAKERLKELRDGTWKTKKSST